MSMNVVKKTGELGYRPCLLLGQIALACAIVAPGLALADDAQDIQ